MEHLHDYASGSTQQLNVILFGQSGVGKSTFINAFINYLKYESLEELLSNKLEVLIPSRFDIVDNEFKQHVVEIGENQDENEVLEAGKSATQNVKSYVFPLKIGNQNFLLRFLDTPGMADVRGGDQDQINCEHILRYISQLKEIHAFCIFLKPDNPRLDILLNYCILQIFSRLDASAVNNLLFLFTNSRGQNFKPGQTFTPLRILLDKIKDQNNINVPLSKMNMFCFDNETFRYAAAIKKGVGLDDSIFKVTESSWEESSKEIWRLIAYVIQLKPHDLKATLSVNDAKAMASNLTKPITEIAQLIDDNIVRLKEQTKELSNAKMTKEELLEKIYTPRMDIRVKILQSPQTVCTHPSCTSFYSINGIQKIHFKQRCCLGCQVTFVSPSIVGSPELYICSAFDWCAICRVCKHSLKLHQHIYYETEVYEKKCDMSMALELQSQTDVVQIKEEILRRLEAQQVAYSKEKNYIMESGAMFDQFLQNNSLTNTGSPIQDYFQQQIQSQTSLNPSSNNGAVGQLQRLLAEYQRASSQNFHCSANDIEERRRHLISMEHFGSRIGELYGILQGGVQRGFNNAEVVVPVQEGGWTQKVLQLINVAGAVSKLYNN